ncbi:S26 family signal peptidase [Embleya sp. NPDC050493]|uniref:S26 family signal peptidase n=1 Tax=Embleya sp. NPDC050493 TaxID=3363989 RepID=UPI00379ED292
MSGSAPPRAIAGRVLAALAVGAGIGGLLRYGLVTVTVRGASMAPAFRDGDRVLVLRTRAIGAGGRLVPAPGRGRVVVAERPDSESPSPDPARKLRPWLVKRVRAAPGDPVPHASVPGLGGTPDGRVPANRWVLLGDNPTVSVDSRDLGYFTSTSVRGLVLCPLPPVRTPGADFVERPRRTRGA